MKKVILSAAIAMMAISANAQSTEFRSEDEADINLSVMLPNWIDIDPEVSNLSVDLNTNGSNWTTLENGWNIGSVNFTVSATRMCDINLSATNLSRPGGGWGNVINVNRLSAMSAGITGGINAGNWGVEVPFQSHGGNNLSTGAQTVVSSTAGGHNVTFNLQVGLYKGAGHNIEDYYDDNLIGSLSVPLTGDMDFLAILTNP